MPDTNPGVVIEGVAVAAKNRVFGSQIDRHHPEVDWANADTAASPANFEATKAGVTRAIESLNYTIYHEQGPESLLNEMDSLSEAVKQTTSPSELGAALTAGRETLDRALAPPAPPKKEDGASPS